MAKLGDICTISSSNAPMANDQSWLLNLDMVEQQTGEIISYNYVGNDDLNGSIIQFDTDNVLYSKLRPNLNKVVIPDRSGFATSEMLPLKPNTSILCREYLAAYLRSDSFVSWAVSKTAGAKMPRLGTKVLLNKEIPLPPLEEQHHIATILDKLTNLIAKRRAQLEKLDLLVKSRFLEMFGVLGTDQFGWGLKKLGQCCEINPKKANDLRLQANLEVSFVPMTAVSENGIIDTSDSRKYDDVKSGFTYFSEEDVLFAKITPCMENGKGAVAKKLKNGIGFGSTEFHVLRPIYGVSDCYWLYVMSIFSEFRKEAELKMTGSAGQRRVPVSFLEEYKVALPPIELQKQFASFVQQIETTKSNIQKSLETLETLKKALMQEYFG